MLAALLCSIIAPKLEHRWIYVQTNLQVTANADRLLALMDRGAKAGYNGILLADTKIQIADIATDTFRKNVRRVRDRAADLGFEIVPSVFSVGYADAYGVLDPNVLEGMPVRKAPFTVHAREATPDGTVNLANGGFESARGDAATNMAFQDGPGEFSFIDTAVKHSGAQSLRFENPKGNARVCQRIELAPWRQYRLSAWIRSEQLRQHGEIRLFALAASGKSLSFQSIPVAANQDWTRTTVTFNSQEGGPVNVYVGTWGGFDGKLWVDDWAIEDAGLLNVVRRKSAPLVVTDESGATLTEGVDFEPIRDDEFLRRQGAFDSSHAAPTIRMRSDRFDGKRLLVSYHHVVATDFGKTGMSLTDPAALKLLAHEAETTQALFGGKSGFMLAHDEIRVAGWSEPARNAGDALAEHLRWSRQTLRKTAPGCPLYVWNDMFDPFHNATKSYYLCNGSTESASKNFPADVTVVNWNYGERSKSMPFFAALGCKQILAGYYDSSPDSIRSWLADASKVTGITGVVYTTWQDKYDDLERFARAAWGK